MAEFISSLQRQQVSSYCPKSKQYTHLERAEEVQQKQTLLYIPMTSSVCRKWEQISHFLPPSRQFFKLTEICSWMLLNRCSWACAVWRFRCPVSVLVEFSGHLLVLSGIVLNHGSRFIIDIFQTVSPGSFMTFATDDAQHHHILTQHEESFIWLTFAFVVHKKEIKTYCC